MSPDTDVPVQTLLIIGSSEKQLGPSSEATALEGKDDYVEYLAAGKLKGNKAFITGGEYVFAMHPSPVLCTRDVKKKLTLSINQLWHWPFRCGSLRKRGIRRHHCLSTRRGGGRAKDQVSG